MHKKVIKGIDHDPSLTHAEKPEKNPMTTRRRRSTTPASTPAKASGSAQAGQDADNTPSHPLFLTYRP